MQFSPMVQATMNENTLLDVGEASATLAVPDRVHQKYPKGASPYIVVE